MGKKLWETRKYKLRVHENETTIKHSCFIGAFFICLYQCYIESTLLPGLGAHWPTEVPRHPIGLGHDPSIFAIKQWATGIEFTLNSAS